MTTEQIEHPVALLPLNHIISKEQRQKDMTVIDSF